MKRLFLRITEIILINKHKKSSYEPIENNIIKYIIERHQTRKLKSFEIKYIFLLLLIVISKVNKL